MHAILVKDKAKLDSERRCGWRHVKVKLWIDVHLFTLWRSDPCLLKIEPGSQLDQHEGLSVGYIRRVHTSC